MNCMAVHDQRLWLGGSFHFAGGEPAWNLTSLTVDDITGGAEADLASVRSLLASPVPNPFNPKTTVSFDLSTAAEVRLDVYNSRGLRVARIVDGHRAAGPHAVTWNGRDQHGRNLPSGVYVLRLEAGQLVSTAKMTLAR